MFFSKSRVDSDLEKIRRANLPQAELDKLEQQESTMRKNAQKLRPKELFSIIIAIYSIVLPYALAIGGVLLLVYLLVRILAG